MGGVSFWAQVLGTLGGIVVALVGGGIVYGILKKTFGIRLDAEEEFNGADISIHKIGTASSDAEGPW
jgi:Amt family ammonium transporter